MAKLSASDRIYVDTNIWIYFVEGNAKWADRIEAFFREAQLARSQLVTSELAIAECLYRPAKDGNHQAIAAYDRLFGSGEIGILALNSGIIRLAAMHGGQIGLKLIDAIHYMTALDAACEYFATSDSKFRSGPKMQIISFGDETPI